MASKRMTLERLRDELPITKNVAYLQVGSHGPTPASVLDVVREEMELEAHYHGVASVTEPQKERETQARERLASFLNVKPNELAMTLNTTQAMRRVSRSMQWEEGDEFIVSSLEHVSTMGHGIALQEQVGVTFKTVEADQGDAVFLESLKSAITERTKLVCVSHVASPDGRIIPVADVADLAHEQGVPVLVDVAQSVGTFPVDIPALGCDFMVGSGHKWLLGPMGTGILWVATDQLAGFNPDPIPEKGPWSTPGAPPEAPTAQGLAEGGTYNSATVIGLGRAVEITAEIGTDVIAAHVGRLSKILKDEAAQMKGVTILTPTEPGRSAGITTLTFDGYSESDLRGLVSWIYEKHNAIVKPQWLTAPLIPDLMGMRISIASFNTEEEVRGLIAALNEWLSR